MTPSIASAIRRAQAWLASRGKTVSKHIGHHTHSAANAAARNPRYQNRALGLAEHSVFRDPRPRKLIERALESPTRADVQRNGYIVVEKEFNRPIGKAGETALRIIISPRSGKIVTAFPIRLSFAEMPFVPRSIVGADFDERVENTILNIDRMIDHYQAGQVGGKTDLVSQVLDFLIDPTAIGEPRPEILAQIESLIAFHIDELAHELERALGTSLGDQRAQLAEQFRSAVASVAGTLDD